MMGYKSIIVSPPTLPTAFFCQVTLTDVFHKKFFFSYSAGDERMPQQKEEVEREEPNLPPSDHQVIVGNLLVKCTFALFNNMQ